MGRPLTQVRIPLIASVLAGVLLLPAACTYAEEPGLFGPRTERTDPQFPEPTRRPTERPPATNPELPVAGDAVWTSSEGLRLTSRIAVHAVRRTAGATVLDFSVTPLSGPGLQPGQPIPTSVDFGLGVQTGGDVTARLLDVTAGQVYRPLQHRSRRQFQHCLCTPPWVARLDLRLGETRLLQAAFPALPTTTRTVDVSLGTVGVFSRVPVTPAGAVPTGVGPVDLLRPPADEGPLAPPVTISDQDAQPARHRTFQVDAIETGPDVTSLRWTLRSLTPADGTGAYPVGPPLQALPRDGEPPPWQASTASGPQLQVGNQTIGPLRYAYRAGGRTYTDCVCTGFGPWASALRQAGGRASGTTVYPRLPPGTTQVDVVLPTAAIIWRLPVSPGFDGSARSGRSRPGRVDRWNYRIDRPPAGWSVDRWPTPLPDPAQLADYDAFVERVLPSSSR